MPVINKFHIFLSLLSLSATASVAFAEVQQVGRFVQLRGTATIERGKSQVTAKVKDGILASDTITTAASGRAKLLFIDDSVLTMSDNSKLVVKEFIYSKGEQGKSVFNLLDGKMRSVVGKTKFEVHTPTAVAAARGTVIFFDVSRGVNNQAVSRIICLEGNVQIRNVVSTIAGQVTLTPGTMVTVRANEPPPPPVPAPPAELERARRATHSGNGNQDGSNDGGSSSSGSGSSSSGDSSSGSGSSGGTGSSSGGSTSTGGSGSSSLTGSTGATGNTILLPQTGSQIPTTPPIQQQPIVQPRKVNINIGIPTQ